MLTYSQAAELFAKARCKHAGRKLANNTRLVQCGDDFLVVLHSTAVVRICADGSYVLNSGTWRTRTTADRINAFSPARVYQRDFQWYLAHGLEFYDGVVVDAGGRVLEREAA